MDLYEDDNDIHDQIFDISQDRDFNDRIIFNQYQDYEEDTPIVNDEQIDVLDGVNLTDVTLEGRARWQIEWCGLIDCVDNEKHDL